MERAYLKLMLRGLYLILMALAAMLVIAIAGIAAEPRLSAQPITAAAMPNQVKFIETSGIAETDRQDFLIRSKDYTKQHSKRRLSERLAELRNLQAEIILPKARAEETAELRAEIKALRAGKLIPAPLSRPPRPGEIGSLLARSMTIVKIKSLGHVQCVLTADDLERDSEADNGPAIGWTFTIEGASYGGDVEGLAPGDQLGLGCNVIFQADAIDARLIRVIRVGDLLSLKAR